MGRAISHQINISTQDGWETPPLILAEAMEKYNIYPTLDVCATDSNFKCDWYITPEMNALEKPWDSDFFMNPPYSQVNQWLKYAYQQHKKYNVNALILVFSKTDTAWWHDWIEKHAEVHFIKGRIRFLLNGIEPRRCKVCKKQFVVEITHCPICNSTLTKQSPPYGNVWVIFRKDEKNE